MPELIVLAALILERPMCTSCIASKAGEPSGLALEAALGRVGLVFDLHRGQGHCRACGMTTIVLSINRPARAAV